MCIEIHPVSKNVQVVISRSADHGHSDECAVSDVGKNAIGKNAIGKIAIGKNARW